MTTPFCRHHRKASELPPSEMTRAQKYEIPFSPDWGHTFERHDYESQTTNTKGPRHYARGGRPVTTPYTESQAIMESPPGAPIPKSIQEGYDEHERIVDAIDRLDPRSRWIFDAIALGGKSYRVVAAELGLHKTHIARLYHAALNQLQTELKDMVNE